MTSLLNALLTGKVPQSLRPFRIERSDPYGMLKRGTRARR